MNEASDHDLQLKKVPTHIKSLIDREAALHRRSINQETIVLLEEALLARARLQTQSQENVEDIHQPQRCSWHGFAGQLFGKLQGIDCPF